MRFTDIVSFARHYQSRGLPAAGLVHAAARYWRSRREHGLEIGEFFEFRLWRPELARSQYLGFLGWRKHIAALVALNPLPYRCLTENKLLFYLLCRSTGVPTPEVYAVLDPELGQGGRMPILRDTTEVPGFLADRRIAEFVLKPVDGTRGQAVWVLRRDPDEGISMHDGRKVTAEGLKGIVRYEYRGSSGSSFLIQERLTPHDCSTEFSPLCPLSYRVITLVDGLGKPHILYTYGKLPAKDAISDNLQMGGLALLADDRGICLGARARWGSQDLLTHHPGTGSPLVGWELPFYDEVRALSLRTASEFSLARCVAWDIAVSRQGIMVYEGNNPFNKGIQTVYDTGLWHGVFAAEAAEAMKNPRKYPPWW